MRKIFLCSIVPAMIAVGVINSHKASAISVKNKEMWTVSEVLELSKEAEQERKDVCGEDFACIKSLHDDQIKTNYIYSLIDKIESLHFIITAIDFETGTMSVIYQDESRTARWSNPDEILDLSELYIVWIRKTKLKTIKYQDYALSDNENKITVYSMVDDDDADVEWMPANEEIIVNIRNDLDEGELSKWILGYYANTEKNYGTYGMYNLSSCLQDDDYNDDCECRLMTSHTGGTLEFRPVQVRNNYDMEEGDNNNKDEYDKNEENERKEVIEETHDNDDVTEQQENQEDDEIEDAKEKENIRENIDDSDRNNNKIINNEENIIKAPNTGFVTLNINNKSVDLPWWIIAIVAISDVTLAYFFWPKRQK